MAHTAGTPTSTPGALWPAYAMAVVNTLLGLITAFGVALTQEQTAAIVPFVNAVLLLVAHVTVNRKGEADYAEGQANGSPPGTVP